MEAIAHRGVATLCTKSLTDRNYVGTLLYTKYISCVPHGFREEDILSFIIISPLDLLTRGHDQIGPSGLIGRICVENH